MRIFTQSLIFLLLVVSSVQAEYIRKFFESEYPVAITFLVADYKYNEEQGVKLCEVQQASLSLFTLGRYVRDGKCLSSEKFVDLLERWGVPGWYLPKTPCDRKLRDLMRQSALWTCLGNFSHLLNHPDYVDAMKQPIDDPNSISSYRALVYGRTANVKEILKNRSLHPATIIIDEPTFPYWIDKFKMSELFGLDPILEKIKPVWKNYLKNENPESIYEDIIENFPGDYVVIKPRKCFKSNGILLIHKDDLLNTIKLICTKSPLLLDKPDPSMNYWQRDRSKSFLVEEFIESDPMLTESGRLFDTTYRTTFLFSYENHEITLHFLDSYLKYPRLALDESGSYKDKHISHIKKMEKCLIPQDTLAEIEQQLSEPLLLMFEKMLSDKH